MKILVPKRWANPSPFSIIPTFFLAGPIRGGGDWQKDMALELCNHVSDCIVVSPCRWKEDHALANHFMKDEVFPFPDQLSWERHYLEQAAFDCHFGCIIFWLPCESKVDPHPGPEPYAMDTRGELGEWRGRMKYQSPRPRVVVGAEKGFHGLSQIERNFDRALECYFPIHPTMEKTAEAAVAMANSR